MTVSTDGLSQTESSFMKPISSKSMEVFLILYSLYLYISRVGQQIYHLLIKENHLISVKIFSKHWFCKQKFQKIFVTRNIVFWPHHLQSKYRHLTSHPNINTWKNSSFPGFVHLPNWLAFLKGLKINPKSRVLSKLDFTFKVLQKVQHFG